MPPEGQWPRRAPHPDQVGTDATFSADELLAEFAAQQTIPLVGALQVLAEYALLARRLARWARERDQSWMAAEFEARARAAEQHARFLRRTHLGGDYFA